MNVAAVICVRMSSQRLPGKVLSVYDEATGRTNLECIIDRVKHSRHSQKVIVATSTDKIDDAIVKVCERVEGVTWYRGSLNNVVERFNRALLESETENAFTHVWRVMADNPLIDIGLVDHRLDILERTQADLLFPILPEPTYAAQCNVWSREAWAYCAKHSSGSLLEHPGEYLYQQLSQFRAISDPGPENIYYQPIRTELDTPEDLEFFRRVYKNIPRFNLGDSPKPIDAHLAMIWLTTRPDIVSINAHIDEKTHTTYLHGHHRARKLHCENEACRAEIATKVNDRIDIRCPKCGQSKAYYP